ncbi:KH domain-containing protein [Anoxybacillus flavithermus]|uniref:KH domain-containing protein n=1 Tax=Anoxybacillus flavithermus TaxID=33934 RepID=UPI000B49DFAE|nr:KH domain-containing protein [Anoxybacillus flavithermus]ASA96228.1 hypothetical protein CA592_04965 [Anoxybacillus flavithermus]
MKMLLETIVRSLVDHPECVVIRETEQQQSITYAIALHHEDVGKVIGKNGRMIQAIRTVVQAANESKKRIDVRIEE